MAGTTIKDPTPKATVASSESVSSEALETSVVALGDAAVRTQGGGGSGSDDKRYLYQ